MAGRERGTDHLAKLVGRHDEDEMLRGVAPLFLFKKLIVRGL